MKPKKQKEIIVLAASGSGGPVTPLLALVPELEKKLPAVTCVLIGSGGVEHRLAKKAGVDSVQVWSGKLRRYWSLWNFLMPIQLLVGLVQSYRFLGKDKVLCVVGAGGFVQVPVMWAAWLRGIPVVVHQQDVVPGLANKLCAPLAKRVTVALETSTADFPAGWILGHLQHKKEERVVWTGNPARTLTVPTKKEAVAHFHLDAEFPTVLVMGGGTGALALNELVANALPQLTGFANVLHLTGAHKASVPSLRSGKYKQFEFLDDMGMAYAAADIVVCRAGMGSITELALLGKPAIIIPMPHSHQEANADVLNEKEAALVVPQELLTPENFSSLLRGFLFEHQLHKRLARNLSALLPQNATAHLARIVASVARAEQ